VNRGPDWEKDLAAIGRFRLSPLRVDFAGDAVELPALCGASDQEHGRQAEH
jgi:hypothetical protein